MDEAGALELAIDTAHQIAAGEFDEQGFADQLLRVFDADAGVGFTVWMPHDHVIPHLVTSGCAPMPYERIARAASFADSHPGFVGMRRVGTSEGVRMSNEVSLRRFWGTDSWEAMHGHSDGRYPVSALLFEDPHMVVFIGLHRRDRDFTDEELVWLTRAQQPIATAYRYRAAVDRAVARLFDLSDEEDEPDGESGRQRVREAPTRREAQVLALMAAGWTNIQIAARLNIAERTVRKHLSAVYEKAHVPGRAAAATWWTQHRDDFVR